MKKTKKTPVILFFIFCLLLSITTLISFSSNTTTQEVLIKSITPVYDETSGVVVSDEGVVFNDKNQVVKYNVVLENTQNYDVKIADIKLSTPTEEFLSYKVEGVSTEDEIKANSTKELTVSFETMGIKGWGRNFADELTANISFEKVVEEVIPPVEEDKEEEKQPEAPVTNTEELISKAEKIEIIRVTKDTIEFKETNKLENGDKIAVWLYSEPIFLGHFDIVEKDGTKQIVGLEETLKKVAPKAGNHNLALVSEEQETIGYVSVYINENKELLKEKPQDSTSNEEIPKEEDKTTEEEREETDSKDESSKEDENGKVENPYTSDKKLVGLLIITTCITGVAVIVASKNKLTKYTVFILMLSPAFTITNAEEVVEVTIKNNISFKSQNVMEPSYILADDGTKVKQDYWAYREQIKNFYIHNEVIEIKDYAHKFDVTESGNARVIAYLVANKDDASYYDAYLVADGIIYPNPDAYCYFQDMKNLDILENLAGLDTSEVTNMMGMFSNTGYNSKTFMLDLSSFDTSNVTNMRAMFQQTGYSNEDFVIDLSSFDTSKVTNMRLMFYNIAYNSKKIKTLDLSGFDTSKVTDMAGMFQGAGYSSEDFSINVSNFDTSNVTNMEAMFNRAGYSSKTFSIDVSNFDTSNVTDMKAMFQFVGYFCDSITLDLSNFNTKKVTNMSYMFNKLGYNSSSIDIDTSTLDTSNVTDMSYMFNQTGFVSTMFELDVSNFDTSNVTNMSNMFSYVGYNSQNLVLNLGSFDTSKVTNMSFMFRYAGYNSENMEIDLSSFDTSKVTDMSYMFSGTGYNSTKLNTSITIRNPNITSYESMLESVAVQDGTKLKVNYTTETEELVDKMIATKSENSNVVKGNLIVDVDKLTTGDEIHISGEKFNVISQTDDTITMLAQLNLGTDYKQSTTSNGVYFGDSDGWEYTPGPKEIDIQAWSTNPKTYVNEYVMYLNKELGDDTIKGNLISLTQLKELGCTINDDYSYSINTTCENSKHYSWLITDQKWWSRSANSSNSYSIWEVDDLGKLQCDTYIYPFYGIRPVITISKETLRI